MILNEVVLEGVRCFRDMRRISLKPGFNLVYGPNESGKSTLFECLYILLDPTRSVGDDEHFPTWGPPGKSRAGLVIQEGQEVFRLTKDFVNGQVSLSRRNPQTQKFESLTTDPSKIDGFLRQNLGIPPVSTLRKLFTFDRSDLPSGRSKVIVKKVQVAAPDAGGQFAGMAAAQPAMPATPPPGYGLTIEEKKQRLEELRAQRDKSKDVASLQYEMDGLESKLFELENKLKNIVSMEDQYDQIQRELNKLNSFQELPPDIIHRIEDFEGAQREQNKLVTVLDQKVGEAQSTHTQVNSRGEFFKERNFIIGIVCIVAGVAAHVAGISEKLAILKLVPPLAIVAGVVLSFWVVWNELNARGAETEAKQKLDKLREELREHEKKFDVESSVLKRMMVDAGVEDPKELHDKLKEYRTLSEKLDDLKARIEKAKKVAGYDQLEREQKEFKERIEDLNRRLRDAGGTGFVQDPADIQRQIDAMQFSIDHPDSAPPQIPGAGPGLGAPPPIPGLAMPNPGGGMAGDFLGGGDDLALPSMDGPGGGMGAPAGDKTFVSDSSESESSAENPVDSLWAAAEAFTGMDRSTLIMQIKDRFNSFVQAFTNNTYNEGDLSSEKTLSLRNYLGSYTDLERLPPSSQDAAWLALKLSVIENLLKKKVVPILLDDPLRLLDDFRLANVSKALKGLGGLGQVLLLSTQRAHSKIADNALSLANTPEKT